MLGEGEIGMTEKLLGNRLLNRGIDDFGLQPGNPQHSRFRARREMDPTLNRPRTFHRAINLIQPIGIGHERLQAIGLGFRFWIRPGY